MKRHELDAVSLVAGVLFVGVAAAFLLGAAADVDLDARWIAPAVLVVLGTTGLLASLSRLGREAGAAPRPGRRGRGTDRRR